jgi:hypothetical protein
MLIFGINTPAEDILEIKNHLASYRPQLKILNVISEGSRLKYRD